MDLQIKIKIRDGLEIELSAVELKELYKLIGSMDISDGTIKLETFKPQYIDNMPKVAGPFEQTIIGTPTIT